MTTRRSQRSRALVGVVVLAAVLAAGVVGWLLGHDSGGGTRVTSLAQAINLANAGDLPTGGPGDQGRDATTTPTASPGGLAPLVVRAVVREKGVDGGRDTLVLSTRSGELTLRAEQIAEVSGLDPLPAGPAAIPVGAHVLVFQSTLGPGAHDASDYRIIVLPPGYGG